MRYESTPSDEELVGLKYLFRPGTLPDSPLIVLVHGRAGTREVMWTFERSLPPDVAVVSFQAPYPDPIGGFSWWSIESATSTESAGREAATLLCTALDTVMRHHNVHPIKVVALGFSQGAALLSVVLLGGMRQLDGVGLLAGFVVDSIRNEGEQGISNSKVFMAHGTTDEIVRVERAQKGAALLRSRGFEVAYVEDEVGHKVGVAGMRAMREWIVALLVRT